MRDLQTEVQRFQKWADAYPVDQRSGEWECMYDYWSELCTAVSDFVANRPFSTWSPAEVDMILYALARDNEAAYIAREILSPSLELLLHLTQASIEFGEPDARSQLAAMLSLHGPDHPESLRLLRTLVQDDNEYVRRMSLKALAHLGAPDVEELALEAWNRSDPNQQYARMMALACLQQIGSSKLEGLLTEAEGAEEQYLRQFAQRLRKKVHQGTPLN